MRKQLFYIFSIGFKIVSTIASAYALTGAPNIKAQYIKSLLKLFDHMIPLPNVQRAPCQRSRAGFVLSPEAK